MSVAIQHDSHFVATSMRTVGGKVPKDYPWHDMDHWLRSIGLPQHAQKFHDHELTGKEMPFLKEAHLRDMGITEVGDRLKILQTVEAYLRGLRNRQRQADLLVFRDWSTLPFAVMFKNTYHISESAIVIRTPNPLTCATMVDNVDMSSLTDLTLDMGCMFGTVTVRTTDPSMVASGGGVIRMTLLSGQAKKVHFTLKSLWEEDQVKLGRAGGKDKA